MAGYNNNAVEPFSVCVSCREIKRGVFPGVDLVDPSSADFAKRFEQSFELKLSVENQLLS
jgi:hypothetical protein